MRKAVRPLAMLLLTALLLTGCSAAEDLSSPEKLLQSCASAAEKIVSGKQNFSALDFTSLQKLNPELYAWLVIPGTTVNLPIAQSESSDIEFYQSHGPDRAENERGCLYTHYRYSGKRFDETVSVIYAKTSSSVSRLDGIEELYRSLESLREHQEIAVVTADQVLRYQVFCASEFSDVLISREYNEFRTEADTSAFLADVRGYHTLRRQIDESVPVASGDRILVLTKKLSRDPSQRFLVLAKLVETTN